MGAIEAGKCPDLLTGRQRIGDGVGIAPPLGVLRDISALSAPARAARQLAGQAA